MTPASRALAAAAAGVAVTSWGSILVKLADAPPLAVSFYRMAFAAAILIPVAWMSREPAAAAPAGGARRTGWMLLSGLCLALHFATWITSLSYTSIGSSVLLVSTTPLFGVALSALSLRERASPAALASIVVAVSGAGLVGGGDIVLGGSRLKGDLLALAGAFFAAAYLMIGRGMRREIGFVAYLTWVYTASAAALLGMCLAAGTRLGPFPAASYGWLALMALGPSLAGHGLLNWAVRGVRAYVVNTTSLAEPLLATLYALVIFGERPGRHLVAGGALILAGLIGLLAADRPRRKPSL